ncbi:MAG TPA: hypothetical protein VHB98_02575 [Chloroflexota bacterium]|jgi:hypothetical protein|nr:hypothetical protein [Chloroflexota bacterium]
MRRLSGLGNAHVPLALFSFACALALLIAEALDANAVGGPVGIAIAMLLVLNGLARLWLRRQQMPRQR